jgi:hypothetical protein
MVRKTEKIGNGNHWHQGKQPFPHGSSPCMVY